MTGWGGGGGNRVPGMGMYIRKDDIDTYLHLTNSPYLLGNVTEWRGRETSGSMAC